MAIGDLNKKFGWIWLLIGPLMGLYITSQFSSLGAAYAAAFEIVPPTPNNGIEKKFIVSMFDGCWQKYTVHRVV